VTGRAADAAGSTRRRCARGPAERRTGLCVTKLDVLDGLPSVQLCTVIATRAETVDILPFGADAVAAGDRCYQEFAGWSDSTFGVAHVV